jgi:ribosome-associated protein
MLKIDDNITIEDWELIENFVRSSGPGGQNVNKVSTAVELRFEALRSPNISDQVKVRLKKIAGRRWTNEGAIIIQVEETRYQTRNREIARKRLKDLILKATFVKKKRIPTKPTAGSQRRRIKDKKQRGEVKLGRTTIRKDSDLDF